MLGVIALIPVKTWAGKNTSTCKRLKKMSLDYNCIFEVFFILEADVQELANHTLRTVVHNKDIEQDRHEQNWFYCRIAKVDQTPRFI